MARVTVEDCLNHVDNRFELVLVAGKRARQISRYGIDPTVDWDNDKATVVALREIALGTVTKDILKQKDPEVKKPTPVETMPTSLDSFSFDDFKL